MLYDEGHMDISRFLRLDHRTLMDCERGTTQKIT
jgi:hypothetical protein